MLELISVQPAEVDVSFRVFRDSRLQRRSGRQDQRFETLFLEGGTVETWLDNGTFFRRGNSGKKRHSGGMLEVT